VTVEMALGLSSLVVKVEVTLEVSALTAVTEALSNLSSQPGIQSVEVAIPSTTLTLTNLPRPKTSRDVLAGPSGPDVRSGLVCSDCHGLRFHGQSCKFGTGPVTAEQSSS
jgi:hypothetical protein